MECPQCKGYQLEPQEVEPGLLGSGCSKCHGVLLPLMNFRNWVDQGALSRTDPTQPHPAHVVAPDSSQAKLCPKCSRLMIKYRIETGTDNRIELCPDCDEAWLDEGEWQLLAALDVQDQLPSVFTDAWQKNIRQQREERFVQAQYEALLGTEDFEKMADFSQWLSGHKHSRDIVQYLLSRL